MERTYKRSVKNYLIDSRYQLKFTLFMVILVGVLMAGLGYVVMGFARSATSVSGALAMIAPEAEMAKLQAAEDRIFYVLIGTGVALIVGLFLYGIKMTHRVAGPLFKIATYVDKIKDDKFETLYPLRKGDQLVAFYEHFREAHETLREQQARDVEVMRAVLKAARGAGAGANLSLAALEDLLQTKEKSLG